MIGQFPNYRFGLGPTSYQNFVLDNLAAIESKAGKVAKKLGVSIEKLYSSIGFDPLHFQFSGGIRHDYAKDAVVEILDDEKRIIQATNNDYQPGGTHSKPRASSKIRKLATFGVLLAGGASISSGLYDLASNEVSPIDIHPREYYVSTVLQDASNIHFLDQKLNPMSSYFDLDRAERNIDTFLSEYNKISHIIDVPNSIEENLDKIKSGIPDGYTLEQGDIFSDERKLASEVSSEVGKIGRHYDGIANADQNGLFALAGFKIVSGLVVSPILAYVVSKKLAGEPI